MSIKLLNINTKFDLELGGSLPSVDIAYHTWGKLNKEKNNVILVCHALTANSDVSDWWPNTVGNGLLLDTSKYFIVCPNILGSCYGSTGPLSINTDTGKPFYRSFPDITFRDIAKAHNILMQHLGISEVFALLGGSIGGMQALEFSIMYPEKVKNLIFVASNAAQSPWAVAINESQRMAIDADISYINDTENGGVEGLKVARSIALLAYRNNKTYNKTQSEADNESVDNFRASSYQRYQGEKLTKRFNAYSYYTISKLADSNNIGRGRKSIDDALKLVTAKVLCIGIDSDILYPTEEQEYVAKGVNNGTFKEVSSFYGHDGFLIETKQITTLVKDFLLAK